MSKLIMSCMAFVVLSLGCTVADASPRHALVKVGRAAVKTVAVAPKAVGVGLKDTLGSILFTAEAGVDVVHAGTYALNLAAGAELKHNPFEYIDKGVGYVDSGLERAGLFFFNVKL